MVHNCFIKCQVCGKITRIRLQVGWLPEHPIVVTCGECGTSLSGKVTIGQEQPGLRFAFDNAEIVIDENADYMVDVINKAKKDKDHDYIIAADPSSILLKGAEDE